MRNWREKLRPSVVRVMSVGAAHVAGARFARRGAARWRGTVFAGHALADPAGDDHTVLAQQRAAVAEVLATLGAPAAPLHVVLPGHIALTRIVSVPKTANLAKLQRLIAFEAEQSFPVPLRETFWDHVVLAEAAGKIDVLVVAAKKSDITRFTALFADAGAAIWSVIPAGIATALARRQHATGTGANDAVAQLTVDVGARTTHLLWTQGARLQLRALALGGNAVTRDLAETLRLSSAEAEQLKCDLVAGGERFAADVPTIAAWRECSARFRERLQAEVVRSLAANRSQSNAITPTVIRFSGGGCRVPELAAAVAARCGLEHGSTSFSADVEWAASARENIRGFGVDRAEDLIGVLGLLETSAASINLVPPALTEARLVRRRRPRWIAAIACLAVAMALPGIHHRRMATAHREAAEMLEREMMPHRGWAESIQKSDTELRALAERRRQMETFAAAASVWPELLSDLQAAFLDSGDVWIDRLQVLPDEMPSPDASVLTLRLSGRLLDRANPLVRVNPANYAKVTQLLERVAVARHVSQLQGERFDAGEPGVLRFDFTLLIDPRGKRSVSTSP